ncbi:MAG TPA: hypothetical protein VHC01_01295, partial [Gaiellaceae bacterium]|nr:hypothetical protein [Gaiellaceae bacterium]
MVSLRTRALRFWLAAVGLLSIGVLYVAPTVEAIVAARPARTLPAIAVPVTWFPPLAIPKLHAAPTIPHIKPAPSTPSQGTAGKQARKTIPVVRESYNFAPASSQAATPSKPGTYAASPVLTALAGAIANAPVTTDQSGTPEAITTTQATPTTDAGVGTDPGALAPGSTTPPTPVTDPTATTPADPASSQPDATSTTNGTFIPAPHNDTNGSGSPPTTTDPAPTDPPPADPAPAGTDTPITSDTQPEISSGSVAPTTPSDPTPPTDSTPTDTSGTPSSPSTAVVLPSAWDVTAGGQTVSVSVSDGNLVVTVGGTSTSKPLAEVSELDVTGPGALELTTAIGIPISYNGVSAGSVSVTGGSGSTWSYDGGSGSVSGGVTLSFENVTTLAAGGGDTLNGPAADSTWDVTGDGSGTVGGASFSGFAHLVGAANNRDQFVFGPNGSISGGIDGGPGGYDTLVLDGGSTQHVHYASVDSHSGSVSRDGNVITYTGLEPVVENGSAPDESYGGTTGDDNIVIADDAGAGDGSFTISANTSESITVTNADQIQTLTIDAGAGNDSVEYDSIDSAFKGAIYIHGSTGTNSLIAGNGTGGAWELTGLDAGSYTPTGGPQITFDGVGSLQGGAGDDTYAFDLDGGLSGGVTDSGGTNTVSVAGLVAATGTGTFTSYQGVSDTLAGDSTATTGLSVVSAEFSDADLFFGVGYGTQYQAGVTKHVSTGNVDLAIVSDPATERAWAAAKVDVSGVAVDLNTATSDGKAVDWTTLGGATLPVFTDSGATISATIATPSFDVDGVISGSADTATANVSQVATSIDDAAQATLIGLSLTTPQITVGSSAAGFTASAASAVVELLLPLAPSSGASDSRWWLGAKIDDLGGSFAAGSALQATVSGVTVLVNTAGGTYTPSTGSPVDATALTWSSDLSGSTPSEMAGVSGEQAQASGSLDSLDLAGVAEGSATTVTIEQSTLSDDGLSLTDGDLLTFGVTGLTGSIGGSGYGVTVSGDFTAAVISGTGADTRQWIAAKGDNLSLDIELAPLSIAATGGSLTVNEATGTGATVITDWTPYGLSLSGLPSTGDYVDVKGAVSSIGITGLGTITVSQAEVQRLDGVDTPDGTGDGSLFTVKLDGIDVDAGDANTSLTIDGGDLHAYALGSSSTSDTWFAIKGSGFTIAATLGPVTLNSSDVNFELNSFTGATGKADWSDLVAGLVFPSTSYFELDSTGTTSVTLPGVTATVTGFNLVRETGVAGPTGTGTGTTFKLELDGTHVDAGASDLTFTLDGGTLHVYGFAVGTKQWVALDGSGFTPDVEIGPLTITSGNFGFTLNTESGTTTAITNWSFGDLGGPTLDADSFDASADTFSISITPFASVTATHIDLSRTASVDGPDGSG